MILTKDYGMRSLIQGECSHPLLELGSSTLGVNPMNVYPPISERASTSGFQNHQD